MESGVPAKSGELYPGTVKRNMKYCEVKEGEHWRVNILKELLKVRAGDLNIKEFEKEESDVLIQHLCIS